jgi:hypothetical protein
MQEIENKLRASSPRDILSKRFSQDQETRTLVSIYEQCVEFVCSKTGFH